MRMVSMLTAGMLAVTAPAFAEEGKDEVTKQKELVTAQKELTTAQKELITAQSELMKARFDALGLKPPEGKTTVDAGAGKIEAAMLNVGSMNAAAKLIADKAPSGKKILLLTGDQEVDLALPVAMMADIDDLKSGLDRATETVCGTKSGIGPAAIPFAAIGAVLSLLRTDTQVSGIDLSPSASQLNNAVAARLGDKAIILGDVITRDRHTGPNPKVGLEKAVTELNDAVNAAFQCSTKQKKPADDVAKGKLAVLDGTIARTTAFSAAIAKSDETKPSLLSRALRYEVINTQNPLLLRLYIENAGGSLLKRSNIWTALGAHAVGLTGGLVVSYRYSDPKTGQVQKSDVLVCRTALTNMRSIQAGRSGASACGNDIISAKPAL